MTSFTALDIEAHHQPYWLDGEVDADYQQFRPVTGTSAEELTDKPTAPYRVFLSKARVICDGEVQALAALPSSLCLPLASAAHVSFDTRKRDQAGWLLEGFFDQLIVLEPKTRFFDDFAGATESKRVQRLGRIQGRALMRRVPIKRPDPLEKPDTADNPHPPSLVTSTGADAADESQVQEAVALSSDDQGRPSPDIKHGLTEAPIMSAGFQSAASTGATAEPSQQTAGTSQPMAAAASPTATQGSEGIPVDQPLVPARQAPSNCLFCRPLWVFFLAALIYLSLDGMYAALYLLITATACVISRLSNVLWTSRLGTWAAPLLWITFIALSFNVFANHLCLIDRRETTAILATSLLLISAWIPGARSRCLSHALWLACCLMILIQSPLLCSERREGLSAGGQERVSSSGREAERSLGGITGVDRLAELAETAKNSLWNIVSGDTLDRDVRNLGSAGGGSLGGRVILSEFEGWFPSQKLCDSASAQTRVIYLGEDAVFQKDSSELSPRAVGVVQRLSKVLNRAEIESIDVVGHSDPSGGDDYNLVLSQARAINLRDILLNYVELQGSKVSAYGLGGRLPLFSSQESPSPLDRRVEIVIVCRTP